MTSPGAGQGLRIDELAAEVGTTARNIRVYQERGLLPSPERRGRTAYYGAEHKQRLLLILRLLDRGYTFATIEELLIAQRHGFSLTDLLEVHSVRSDRRSSGTRRRRLPRGGVQAVTGFELPEDLLDQGSAIGLSAETSSDDHFLADEYMYKLLRELIVLGVDEEGLDRIGTTFMEGQATAASAIEVLVETLRDSGMDQAVIEKRVTDILPGAGAAARLIFLSAVQTLLSDNHGFPKS
ncbi:hypothetical protein NCCP2495_13570 [Dietzia sp. NCCP-2495]|uniref:MerR family transcriptional regulator n=1 Tax=Dietzia sp. NCCP-2495 TaxID=2934675 RepID=UPI00222F9FD5|nr:MerR family transcriptional regulator [Dietzia sp. NCCP-2495]GLB63478.1 hypothetical protein NCCP2495_13570 [Dietzia sp. NCCP-2495]